MGRGHWAFLSCWWYAWAGQEESGGWNQQCQGTLRKSACCAAVAHRWGVRLQPRHALAAWLTAHLSECWEAAPPRDAVTAAQPSGAAAQLPSGPVNSMSPSSPHMASVTVCQMLGPCSRCRSGPDAGRQAAMLEQCRLAVVSSVQAHGPQMQVCGTVRCCTHVILCVMFCENISAGSLYLYTTA